MNFLFDHGPGYWKAKPLYWGLLILFLFITLFWSIALGLGLNVVLAGLSFYSKSQWRAVEQQRILNEASKPMRSA